MDAPKEYVPRTKKKDESAPAADAADARRLAPGVRRASEYFDADHQRREVLRGEYINLRSSEEYARRESTWWRRLWRLLRGIPPVVNMNGRYADAHARTLDALKRDLVAKGDQIQEELTKRRKADMLERARDSRRDPKART